MMRGGIVISVALAALAAGCFDPVVSDRPCATDSDCLAGRVCDVAKKVCVNATADVGSAFADAATADTPATGDGSAADATPDVGWPDAGSDAGDAAFDGSLDDVSFDGASDTGNDDAADVDVDAGTDGGLDDVGLDDGGDAGLPPDGSPNGSHDAAEPADAQDANEPDGDLPDAADAGNDTGVPDTGCTPDCAGKCGGEDNCGESCSDNCVSPDTCGGGGTPNVCGCTRNCANRCGDAADGCGGKCSQACQQDFTCVGQACEHCGIPGERCCDGSVCIGTACKSGYCAVTDCSGMADFMPCYLATTPDRTFDVCVAGSCLSPGCGTAACNVPGPYFPLADTNQRKCYDEATEIVCPASGSPCASDGNPVYCGQDAQYGWDSSNLPYLRFERTTDAEPIVLDTVTGLTWQGCVSERSGTDCLQGLSTRFNWADALSYCEGLSWHGFDDWRLPDQHELVSIVDFSKKLPALDEFAFPSSNEYPINWTLSGYQPDGSFARAVHFSFGEISAKHKTNDTMPARCVRSSLRLHLSRFLRTELVSGEPIVTDNVTGLEWQGCAAGLKAGPCDSGTAATFSWKNALIYCESLNWGGSTDWRLPDVKEMFSTLDLRKGRPTVEQATFPNTPLAKFFTSTTTAANAPGAMVVDVDYGNATSSPDQKVGVHAVRCVRVGN